MLSNDMWLNYQIYNETAYMNHSDWINVKMSVQQIPSLPSAFISVWRTTIIPSSQHLHKPAIWWTVFKTSDSSADMHISVRLTMHVILSQWWLDYAAFSNGFQVKMPPFQDKTPFLQAKSPVMTPTSNSQAELLLGSALSNHWMNVEPHLTVNNLYTQFH